jgi:hypothetical protein
MNTKQALRLAAPYLAVLVFWCMLSNAWLAILAYHAQVLFWARRAPADLRTMCSPRCMLLALPASLAGPVLYFLLPYMTHTDLSAWLINHHLTRVSFAIMIPYFGLVHPVLEQLHWAPLRERTRLAHPLFAGYHLVVLYSLLTLPWLMLCFVALTAASFAWQSTARRSRSLAVPVASHILADLGIIAAAWFRT